MQGQTDSDFEPVEMTEEEIERAQFNSLTASRKEDRAKLADTLTKIALKFGATVERQHTPANPGYRGQGIDLTFACKGVGAMIDISDIHGGEWVLIHWFNKDYPPRNFTSRFGVIVGSGGNGRPHHKATSHPRDWYSLAMFLEGGLCLAFRGEAFEPKQG